MTVGRLTGIYGLDEDFNVEALTVVFGL